MRPASKPPVDALSHSTRLGKVSISREAIAQIVGRAVAECYGVVGMAARGPVERLTGLRVASVDVHIQNVKRTA